jgi:SAM-dependent methyltransferase
MEQNDKAGEGYWTSFWKSAGSLPAPALHDGKKPSGYIVEELDKLYRKYLPHYGSTSNRELLEVGCGNSVWLSYFQQRFGYRVSGIDYSEFGCEQTRRILARDGCSGDIRLGDLFHPPVDLIGKFDVVCSFGVVEHFEDTAGVLSAISRFLKPGGILITTVPVLYGPTGILQRLFNRPVFDIHVLLTRERLAEHLRKSGLSVRTSEYYATVSFGVTLDAAEGRTVKALQLKRFLLKGFQVVGKLLAALDSKVIRLPKGKYSSEGIFTIAVKE